MPSGKKIWYLRTSCSGRVADKKLGEYPDMNLAQARQKARRLRKDIGLEPPKGYVLKDAFRLWCRLKKPQIVSYQDERRRLERYIIGPIGNRQLDEITAPLVIRTVQPIEKDGSKRRSSECSCDFARSLTSPSARATSSTTRLLVCQKFSPLRMSSRCRLSTGESCLP